MHVRFIFIERRIGQRSAQSVEFGRTLERFHLLRVDAAEVAHFRIYPSLRVNVASGAHFEA